MSDIWCSKVDKNVFLRHLISYNLNFQLQRALYILQNNQYKTESLGGFLICSNHFFTGGGLTGTLLFLIFFVSIKKLVHTMHLGGDRTSFTHKEGVFVFF